MDKGAFCYHHKNLIWVSTNQRKSKPSMPHFLLSNVRSLRHKCDELQSVAVKNNATVIAVSETWINVDNTLSLFHKMYCM